VPVMLTLSKRYVSVLPPSRGGKAPVVDIGPRLPGTALHARRRTTTRQGGFALTVLRASPGTGRRRARTRGAYAVARDGPWPTRPGPRSFDAESDRAPPARARRLAPSR